MGRFITFEGAEGSGKTTQISLLYDYLVKNNTEVIKTREIGGTKEAEKIREIIVNSDISALSELLLVMSARSEHLDKVIIPALKSGKWVICDRYIDSTACYQSISSNLTMEKIFQLHIDLLPGLNKNDAGLFPDHTIFLDLPPKIGLERALSRGENNKFEQKKIDFHENVYSNFKKLSENHSNRILTLEAGNKNALEIHNDIISRLEVKENV